MVNKGWKDRLNPGRFDSNEGDFYSFFPPVEMTSTFFSLKNPNNFPEAVTSTEFEAGQWRETQ